MRLFLIRHAETEHNIAGLLAGSTNSRLTTHGLTQTQLLATHLVKTRGLHFTHIVSSDQVRAKTTAGAIAKQAAKEAEARDKLENGIKANANNEAQNGALNEAPTEAEAQDETKPSPNPTSESRPLRVWTDSRIREKCFGERELQSWTTEKKTDPLSLSLRAPFKTAKGSETEPEIEIPPPPRPEETDEEIRQRAASFVREVLVPIVIDSPHSGCSSKTGEHDPPNTQVPELETVIALVSHGITLRYIWAELLSLSGGASKLIHSPSLTDSSSSKSKGKGGEWAEKQQARLRSGWMPGWSNTGFVEVEISPCSIEEEDDDDEEEQTNPLERNTRESLNGVSPSSTEQPSTQPPAPPAPPAPTSPPSSLPKIQIRMTLHAVNATPHLATLKRTRGGVGSAVWDGKQRTLEGMFGGGAAAAAATKKTRTG